MPRSREPRRSCPSSLLNATSCRPFTANRYLKLASGKMSSRALPSTFLQFTMEYRPPPLEEPIEYYEATDLGLEKDKVNFEPSAWTEVTWLSPTNSCWA